MHDSMPEKPIQVTFDFGALTNQPIDDVVLHINPIPPP